MDKVWVVIRHVHPGDISVLGIYRSREAAEAEAARKNALDGPGYVNVEAEEWPVLGEGDKCTG